MEQKTGAVAEKKPVVMVNGKARALPEEGFWKRYSPHYEFPLSSIASVGLHVVIIGALIAVALVIAFNLINFKTAPDVEAVEIVGGGGGNPNGFGSGPGDAPLPPKQENVPDKQPDPKKPVSALPQLPDLSKVEVDPITLPNLSDNGERVVEDGNPAVAAMSKLQEDARKKLFNVAAGQGKGGTGSGGGEGAGQGTGTGDDKGPGNSKGKLSQRQKRLLRWTMVFNTRNGGDYLRQLSLLGATLAVPEPDGQYRVYRDLRPGSQGEIEDLATIKSIYWIDDRPESVNGLMAALGVRTNPPHFVAFFPQNLEDKLAKLEHDYKGLSEDQIHSTRFEIINNEPRVTAQEPARR